MVTVPGDLLHMEAELLKALGHPVRLKVLQILAGEETCVCDLIRLIDIEQSNLSQHLKVLRKHGVVETRRDGSRVLYRLVNPEVLPLIGTAERAVQLHLERMAVLAQDRRRLVK